MYLNKIINIFLLIVTAVNMMGDTFASSVTLDASLSNKNINSLLLVIEVDRDVPAESFSTSFNINSDMSSHCHLGHCTHVIALEFLCELRSNAIEEKYYLDFDYSNPSLDQVDPPPIFFS